MSCYDISKFFLNQESLPLIFCMNNYYIPSLSLIYFLTKWPWLPNMTCPHSKKDKYLFEFLYQCAWPWSNDHASLICRVISNFYAKYGLLKTPLNCHHTENKLILIPDICKMILPQDQDTGRARNIIWAKEYPSTMPPLQICNQWLIFLAFCIGSLDLDIMTLT